MIVVVNDRRDALPEILYASGLRLVERLERHVNRRTGRRAGSTSSPIFVAVRGCVRSGLRPRVRAGIPSSLAVEQPKGILMRKLVRRPLPAMIVACLALLVALGGTSVAAVSQLVPRNSVGPAQLRTNAVTNAKVANNAITGAEVRNRSLLRTDFAPGQLPAGPTGRRDRKGRRGLRGQQGLQG